MIEVSPTQERLLLESGEIREGSVSIKNDDDEAMSVSIYVAEKPGLESSYSQLARWLSLEGDSGEFGGRVVYTLAPSETKEINYKITAPESVAGGGQYASLFVESNPSESEGIKTITRLEVPFYAEIAGETRRESEIESIDSRFLHLDQTIGVQASVKNTGNVDFLTTTEMTVATIFGKQLYSDSVSATIYPEGVKTILLNWDAPPVGLYRLSYTVHALDQTASSERLVLSISPTALAIIVLLVISALVALVKIRARCDKLHKL